MRSNHGSIMMEALLCLMIETVFSMSILHLIPILSTSEKLFADQYLYLQTEAIRTAQRTVYTDPAGSLQLPLHFNENGNINTAMTLPFALYRSERTVIELGMGRLVFYGRSF